MCVCMHACGVRRAACSMPCHACMRTDGQAGERRAGGQAKGCTLQDVRRPPCMARQNVSVFTKISTFFASVPCMGVWVRMCVHTYMFAHPRACVHACVRACRCACVRAHAIHACVCARACWWVCACIHACNMNASCNHHAQVHAFHARACMCMQAHVRVGVWRGMCPGSTSVTSRCTSRSRLSSVSLMPTYPAVK